MTPAQFVHTLQFIDSFFPVGSFAYSDGLESAATAGRIRDADSLGGWLHHFLHGVFVPCDGPALLKALRATGWQDWATIQSIDEELTAMKPAAATRASSRSVGKRLLATYSSIFEGAEHFAGRDRMPPVNAPVVYGMVLSRLGLEGREALLAFGYARMANIVSAGLRLISLGQQQGQSLLTKTLEQLPAATEHILEREAEPLRTFNPLVDIQQMNHRYVYSRLFRS